MPQPLEAPPTLLEYLEAGGDLTEVPGLENYAKVIIGGWYGAITADERDCLAWWFVERATALMNGEPVEDPNGELMEGAPGLLRHYVWMANGLGSQRAAQAFEAALPEELVEACKAQHTAPETGR
ncbi:MAG: hypothetical protein M3404_11270 [Actinomycetota bacterium]|nr:hypothetical protein [Actinomycetota bacterium]